MKHILLAGKIALLSLIIGCQSPNKVEIILYNGIVYSLDGDTSTKTVVIIDKGKIVATGNSELKEQYSGEKEIDLEGKAVYPGLIDAHCHFTGYGLDKYKCKLFGTKSYEEVLERINEYEKSNKYNWIYGRGWDQNDWEIKEFPDNSELNKLYPNKPVILKRIDGHAILVNSKALELAGINTDSQIPGGIVEKKNGKLTGILIDNAMEPVERIVAKLPETDAIAYLKEAEKDCYKYGLTGVVDCGLEQHNIELLRKLYSDGILSISTTALLSQTKNTLDNYVQKGPFQNGQLKVSGIKIYADGALGSRGACLLEDYSDRPGERGLLLSSIEEIRKIAEDGKRYNWQICTHAIGDSANSAILKLYGEILGGENDLRWRIEHAQVIDYKDYINFKYFSIIPSVQPTHATSDMPWAGKRLGERLPTAYAFKELLKQNGWIALGTDFPVEEIDPIATFYAAVVRKDKNGNPKDGFQTENALSRIEALKGMTIWAARSVFNEKTKGSLEPGKDADITILDKDIMTLPENEILNAKVVYTIVQGKVKYSLNRDQ